MTTDIRQDETKGTIDERLLALERSLSKNSWDDWFGKHPGIVLGSVISALLLGFWAFYTWNIDQMTKEYESRLQWAEKQKTIELNTQKSKYHIDLKHIESQLNDCLKRKKHNTQK